MKWRNKLIPLLLVLMLILTPGLAQAQNFVDVEGHWAEQNLILSLELHWIQGDGTERLDPNRAMTRAEFVTMAYRTLELDKLPIEGEVRHVDLGVVPWAEDILLKSDRLGILSIAFPGNTLEPNEAIYREQAVVLLDHISILKNILSKGEDPKLATELAAELME